MKKRVLSLLLVLVMVLGMIPATTMTAHAAENYLTKAPENITLAPGESKGVSVTFAHRVTGGADWGNANISGRENGLDRVINFGANAGTEVTPYTFVYDAAKAGTTETYWLMYTCTDADGNNFPSEKVSFTVTYEKPVLLTKAPENIVLAPGESKGVSVTFAHRVIGGADWGNAIIESEYGIVRLITFGANAGTEVTPYTFVYDAEKAGTTETYWLRYTCTDADGNYFPKESVSFTVTYTNVIAPAPEVYVGGVGMYDGDYLAVGATKTHTTKPSGGYAYYNDGTLTLNNYSYEGKGYQYGSDGGFYATVYAEHDLTVELVGTNTLTQTAEQQSDVICVHNLVGNPDLTVDGDGKLVGTADDGIGLSADGDLTINGGTIAVTTYYAGIMSFLGNVSINGGDIIAESKKKDVDCIYASYDVTINGGNVTAIGTTQAIGYGRSVTIAKGLIIRASTTADGELGEYTATNHTTYKKIVITPKPEIKSVKVNGTSVADGATVTVNSKNVTIKTTYDSTLSQALTDYGCTVKEYGQWYLNGEKLNIAATTPVSNGDGTSTKTYTRPLNPGDELKVHSRLEVTWPDGTKDIVDEQVTNVFYMDVAFDSLNPTPTASELTNKYTDLGTMDLGSAATNIDFKAFPKKLSAAVIADGWTTGRSISVTRDGVEIYNKTYADNELFGWNLKDNIDEGGTYLITLRVFAQKGRQIVEKTHKYRVFIKGSTIKTISLEGVGTPVIGKSPSTINTVKSNTDGVVVKKVIWNYWTSEMGGNWLVMPSGSKFEAGKRYAVEVELQTADGYSFTANKSDMTVYINGEKAGKSVNYDSNKFSAELEFEAITTPTFTTQPVGGEAPYGGKHTVSWQTNFTPCKIVVGEYNSKNQVVNQVEYSNTTTSVELPANQYGYVVIAYYNDANAKYSNKITITEVTPAFTTQPVGGEVAKGEKLTVSWATNFTPVKTVLMKVVTHPVDGTVTTRETLGTASTAEVGAGYDYYFIRAYTETSYVDSDKFYVTEKSHSSMIGDINNDGYVNDEDVILLLWHTLLPDLYPIDADGDINGDGSVNDEDVILLLWHTLLPDLYPI